MSKCGTIALFPGLPTVHFLIACSMQKNGPGPFYHVNDVRVYLGRQRRGGVPNQKNTFVHVFFVFRFANVRKSSTWGRNYKIRPQARLFGGGSLPHSVDTDVTHVIKWTRTPSSIFAYCKRSKNWTEGRPGNETIVIICTGCLRCLCIMLENLPVSGFRIQWNP